MEAYPANPNGSRLGKTGVRTPDGQVLALMPHPERTVPGGGGGRLKSARELKGVGRIGTVVEKFLELQEVGRVNKQAQGYQPNHLGEAVSHPLPLPYIRVIRYQPYDQHNQQVG